MTRFLMIAALALLAASAVQAADDGGFGSSRFSDKAPSALSEDDQGTGFAAAPEFNPADIEPAAGDEEPEAGNQDVPAAASAETDQDPDAAERPPAE